MLYITHGIKENEPHPPLLSNHCYYFSGRKNRLSALSFSKGFLAKCIITKNWRGHGVMFVFN